MNALMYDKMLPILLWLQHMVAVWASKRKRSGNLQSTGKNAATYFAKIGTPAAGVVVYELMRGIAPQAYRGLRNITLDAPSDRLDRATVLPDIVLLQLPPIMFLKLHNYWEFIGLKLLVCG
jgi:hypothetical protein